MGSITVFLSLVFLLVFALFGTLLETARYTVCKTMRREHCGQEQKGFYPSTIDHSMSITDCFLLRKAVPHMSR